MDADQEPSTSQNKYVAFCDVLGFSNAVLNDFDGTLLVYTDFMHRLRDWPFHQKVQVSMYSDSILVVCDELPPLLYAVKSLWFATMTQNWLIRGGISFGRYWERKEDGHLFVVSDALVRAVRIESTIKVPAVGFSEEIQLGKEAWVPRFQHGLIQCPVLNFKGINLVNPFNPYWFASARMRVAMMLEQFPEHSAKYSWFQALWDAVDHDELLVPDEVVEELLGLGVLRKAS